MIVSFQLLVLCDSLPANQVLMQNTIHRLFYTGRQLIFDLSPNPILFPFQPGQIRKTLTIFLSTL